MAGRPLCPLPGGSSVKLGLTERTTGESKCSRWLSLVLEAEHVWCDRYGITSEVVHGEVSLVVSQPLKYDAE